MNRLDDENARDNARVRLSDQARGRIGAAVFGFIGLVCLVIATSNGIFKPGGARLAPSLAEGLLDELLINITNLVAPIGVALIPAEAIGLVLALISRITGFRQLARGLLFATLLAIALTIFAVVMLVGTCGKTGCLSFG